MSIVSTFWGRASRSATTSGVSGSLPSASATVCGNFAALAVSMTSVGKPGSMTRRATVTPSAVCGSMSRPERSLTLRMASSRSACVDVLATKPNSSRRRGS